MPAQKNLDKIREEIQKVRRESENLAHKQYTPDDIRHLQLKLQKIDACYKEGIIDDRDQKNLNDDPYEHPGQAEIADDLTSVHRKLSSMLMQVSDKE